jgi:hypothetical protein
MPKHHPNLARAAQPGLLPCSFDPTMLLTPLLTPSMRRSTYASQFFQDWVVAGVLHASGMAMQSSAHEPSNPVAYVDLATNHAVFGSNSLFFDRCLGWKGLCIEPNPMYHKAIRKLRTCALDTRCVSDADVEVSFAFQGQLGHITSAEPTGVDTESVNVKITCVRFDELLNRYHAPPEADPRTWTESHHRPHGHHHHHVRYLSLDVEGNELAVLRGVDWSVTTIDTITIERATDEVHALLRAHGIVPALCVSMDTLFVRQPLLTTTQRWHAMWSTVVPGCVRNYTSDCSGGWTYLSCIDFMNRTLGLPLPGKEEVLAREDDTWFKHLKRLVRPG